MPDIFDEINEDLRAEQARKFLARWGGALVGAAVLVIIGVGVWQGWAAWQRRADAKLSDSFIAAMRIADGPAQGRAGAIDAFARIADEAGPGYRTIARLREAALKAEAGDLAGASALWDAVAADRAAEPLLRDLANLQWALHQVDHGDPAAVAARLAPLAALGNPWHPLAEEGQAILAIREGKPDAARDTLKQLANDVTAPDGVRGRANGLLARLGGPS